MPRPTAKVRVRMTLKTPPPLVIPVRKRVRPTPKSDDWIGENTHHAHNLHNPHNLDIILMIMREWFLSVFDFLETDPMSVRENFLPP